MEKRFALFLVLSTCILLGHILVQSWLAPPAPPADKPDDVAGLVEGKDDPQDDMDQEPPAGGNAGGDASGEGTPGAEASPSDDATQASDSPRPKSSADDTEPPGSEDPDDQAQPSSTREEVPRQKISLGSMAEDSPYRMLVTLDNRGASVERIELTARNRSGQLRYRDLQRAHGYLGHLDLRDEPDGRGCRVSVVGQGTPAALAQPEPPGGEPGVRVGDVIRQVDGQPLSGALDLEEYLTGTKPGQTIQLAVTRSGDDGTGRELTLNAQLTRTPLSIVQPEFNPDSNVIAETPASFLMTLESVGGAAIGRGKNELAGLPSLRQGIWEVRPLADEDDEDGPGVEFVFPLSSGELAKIDSEGSLELVKRYRLARTPEASRNDTSFPSYHLDFELEIRNTGTTRQQVAFRLEGPNGLPTEGWWYSNKIHPEWFASAGVRDVIWSSPSAGHRLVSASKIYSQAKEAEEKDQAAGEPLFSDAKPQPIDYAGIDTQYFSVVMQPDASNQADGPTFREGFALPVGDVGEKKKTRVKTTNISFRLISSTKSLAPGEVYQERYRVFVGPKDLSLLRTYGLGNAIEFGWFKWIAILLSWLLHLFASLPLVNYGLAIILLTVLVRSCMMPLSRKAAKNAQMMQQLAPEMKAIAEKYKNDMEKRGQAQRELFAQHSYNPFGGCLLMVLQLPIFIGLYRALSVDIELRDAALIPGVSWCSNLAGPDMLWYWKPYLPSFLADETGWLGPYLNVLPLVTVVLFLVQQKLFMPPATDDQTRMQQQMMKFMMLFMGVLFFRVPSGLCVYFIASSLWGIAERKMLPPPGKEPVEPATASNGSGEKAKRALSKMLGAKEPTSPQERRAARKKRR